MSIDASYGGRRWHRIDVSLGCRRARMQSDRQPAARCRTSVGRGDVAGETRLGDAFRRRRPVLDLSLRPRRGLTLVELLVVMAIIGILGAMLLPAVQMARESARCTQCANNLKNIGLALANFHSTRRSFPLGSDVLGGTEHAWSSRILPFLEEDSLARQIDYRRPWNAAGGNQIAADQYVAPYICPSGVLSQPGKSDYGGVFGTSLLSTLPAGDGPTGELGCGTLIVNSAQQSLPVSAAKITDGLSATLCVGEAVDRNGLSGRWACGRNCFAQTEVGVATGDLGGLHSYHPGGAHGLFADGHVRLLTEDMSNLVLGAICTRNGAEVISSSELAD